jgi:hypothetical protein
MKLLMTIDTVFGDCLHLLPPQRFPRTERLQGSLPRGMEGVAKNGNYGDENSSMKRSRFQMAIIGNFQKLLPPPSTSPRFWCPGDLATHRPPRGNRQPRQSFPMAEARTVDSRPIGAPLDAVASLPSLDAIH